MIFRRSARVCEDDESLDIRLCTEIWREYISAHPGLDQRVQYEIGVQVQAPLQKDTGVMRFRSNQRYPGCCDKMAIGISDTRAEIEEGVLSYRSRMVRGPAGPIERVAV